MNSDTFKFGVSRTKTGRGLAISEMSGSNSDSSCEINLVRRGSTMSNMLPGFSVPVIQADKDTQTTDEFLEQVVGLAEMRDVQDCGM